VSPAKTAEPIEKLFELWTRVGSGNHVLDRGPGPSMLMGNFEGGGSGSQLKSIKESAVVCARTAEAMKMQFGMWTWVGQRKHVLDGCACWHNLVNITENHTIPQPFYGPFSGTTQVSQCQKRTPGLHGARED